MEVQLFISDIDGCLAQAFTPLPLAAVGTLAGFARRAGRVGDSEDLPAFSLCSGRSFPYVEAMAQVLGLQTPVVFEGGGGFYDPVSTAITWAPGFGAAQAAQIEALKAWMQRDVTPGTALHFDFPKRTQAGVTGKVFDEVQAALAKIQRFVSDQCPDLCVFNTPISVDVSVRGATKREAVLRLAALTGADPERVAYIGDTNGDLDALQAVGHSFAPANAEAEVKAAVGRVMAGELTDAVIQAYRYCIRANVDARNHAAQNA